MNHPGVFHEHTFHNLPMYQGWKDVPEHWVSEAGLKERGKRRARQQKPVAVVHIQSHRRHHYHLLYNVTDALERRAYSAREKAALQRVKDRITCQGCGASFVTISPEGNCPACQSEIDHRRDARIDAIRWAQTIINQSFVVLDVETTGLGLGNRVIEIAVLDSAGRVLLNTLLNPEIYIPMRTTEIHGITNEMVKDQPTFQDIAPDLEAALVNKPICIYNVSSDKPFLEWEGLNVSHYQFHCVMLQFSQYYGQWGEYRNAWKWQSLHTACLYCKIRQNGMHRAAADCEATRHVIHAMAKTRIPESARFV